MKMNVPLNIISVGIAFLIAAVLPGIGNEAVPRAEASDTVKLPEPRREGSVSVEEALSKRRSVRSYQKEPVSLAELAQILWAAQGITGPGRFRAAPSAGALYPLEVYVAAGNVTDLPAGVYKYRPQDHVLVKVAQGDRRMELAEAALRQTWMRHSAAVVVFSAVYERTTRKYGKRGIPYVHMEVGHAAQNVYLQAVSLGLGTVTVGAFNEAEVKSILKMPEEEEPLYIMPLGR